jgi:hypothetical protein
MRTLETWLTGLLGAAAALLLPMAALEPLSCMRAAATGLAAACADGSAHLAMGCASIAL